MSNQLTVIKQLLITVKIPLIEEEKLIPLTQSSLLVEHKKVVITQKRLMQTVIFC